MKILKIVYGGTQMLSNHEQAHRYDLKSTALGCKNFKFTYLSSDNVELSEVLNKRSTGRIVIPSFITNFGVCPFEGCNYTEILLDNPKCIPINCESLFRGMKSSTLTVTISHPENIISLRMAFMECSNLSRLHIISTNKNLKTNRLIDLNQTFRLCKNLRSLDLECIDTKNVETMNSTFSMCENLSYLDLSNFNTVNTKSMTGMFCGCSRLDNLDLSGFDTRNLKEAHAMFMWCENLSNLNLGEFRTDNLKPPERMFGGCNKLKLSDSIYRKFGEETFIG